MTPEFLHWLRPQLAVISVGKHNLYGHPTAKALNQLLKINARIVRTDQNGKVSIETDGTSWHYVAERN
jgi:competence protein ComEC